MHYTRKAACCCCLVNLTLLLLLDFKPSEAFAPAASRHSRRPPTMSPASTAVQLAAKTKPGHDDDDFSCEIHFEEERDGVEAVLVVTDGCSEQKPSAVEKSNVPVDIILRYNCASKEEASKYSALISAIEMMTLARFRDRAAIIHSCILDEVTGDNFEVAVNNRLIAHKAKDENTVHLKMDEIEEAINEAMATVARDDHAAAKSSSTVTVTSPVRKTSKRARFKRAVAMSWRSFRD